MATAKDAKNLRELIMFLKKQGGLSNAALADKMGVGKTTIFRMTRGEIPGETETLSKVALFTGLSRDHVFAITGIVTPRSPQYSEEVLQIAALLESATPDVRRMFLRQVRAVLDERPDQPQEAEQDIE